jgi:hypothetical protein
MTGWKVLILSLFRAIRLMEKVYSIWNACVVFLLPKTFLFKLHSRCLQESMWVDKFTFIFISRLLGIFGPKNILWNTCITGSSYFAMLVAACFWVWHSIQHTHIDKSGLVCELVCGSEIIKNLRYCISICLKGLRKTTQSLNQHGWCLERFETGTT